MYNIYYFIIIAIIAFGFIFERILEWLNATWRSKPIPEELKGIYDDEKYSKQQEYSKVSSQFSALTSSFSFILILLFIVFHGFGKLNSWLDMYFENPIIIGLVYFAILFVVMDIIGLPFALYDTFVIEQKFGFNKTTPKTFILDKLKGYLLSAIIGGLVYFIIFKLYVHFEQNFWVFTWAVLALFSLFMSLFYSNLIVPLFNKQKPLPEGELKTAITEFADRVGFKIHNIYEIDGSKRSSRANAYFTGFGPKKRIVLYDTLIKELTTEELVGVLAHEIGHNKKKHTLTGLLFSILQMGIMLYLLSLFISNQNLSQALGVDQPVFHVSLIAFGLLYAPISSFIEFFMNLLSRKNEYQADDYASREYGAEPLISALKKLSANNLSNLTPHPFYVKVNYSHPSLYQRVKNLMKH